MKKYLLYMQVPERPTECWKNLRRIIFCFVLSFHIVGCIQAPKITNFQPPIAFPNETVVIQGEWLTYGNKNPVAVDFNGLPSASFKAVGQDVHATIPMNAASGPVHVKTQYVDSWRPGGIATSPFDFIVVKDQYKEQEPNDKIDSANSVGLKENIVGTIISTDSKVDHVDWFKIGSGISGPWGYAVEILAKPQGLPSGVVLRLDMFGYREDINKIGYLDTYSDNNEVLLWTTTAPNTDIYLKITWVGSTSKNFQASYSIKVSRIKINDTNEPDDDISKAKELKLSNGYGTHTESYLCQILKNGKDIGIVDFYSFKPMGASNIYVSVITPPLDNSDKVHIRILDSDQESRGEEQGSNVAASLTAELFEKEQASGTWYVRVSNAWNEYGTTGTGKDLLPLSCKAPYTILIVAQ